METLVLGGYTRDTNKGISTVVLDTEQGKLHDVILQAEVNSPTYLEAIGDFVFTVVKEDDWAGIGLFEKEETGYRQITTALTKDVNPPCYVSFDRQRQLVYSANYHQGFFEITQLTDEGLEIVDSVQHEGSSIHDNQKSAHVHYVQMDRANECLLVCDLGTDEVYTYRILEDNTAQEVARYNSAKGFGPRHLVQHPSLPIIYIIGELSNEIDICAYQNGILTHIETVSLLPDTYTEWSGAAAIRISQDGRFVYASNRGHNSIVVYKVLETGLLEVVEWVNTRGHIPRDFNFNRTQEFIIVGHQEDGVLALFKRDHQTGKLTYLDQKIAPECVCVASIQS
ncbi:MULTISPECIES: lactonase family protein [unclassified Granulicatella]|uniref:lactonase family protein n=1 Tax=unclassified Granulicatella TaxID=2630493 RepID=UPI00143031F1|nr:MULTISPECIES: lactonase family protein [unclassified Granulicatella]MBF0780391.1 lactonase family protein [Granulicatella sp. 19428wC4_WM01]